MLPLLSSATQRQATLLVIKQQSGLVTGGDAAGVCRLLRRTSKLSLGGGAFAVESPSGLSQSLSEGTHPLPNAIDTFVSGGP